jgi:hypothetical protein
MRTRETQAGHVGVPRRVDDPGALGGRRRPSYLAPALSEIVPAGGPLQTRAAPHQRRVLARQARQRVRRPLLDLCRYQHGAHGLVIPEGATYEEIVARFEARITP